MTDEEYVGVVVDHVEANGLNRKEIPIPMLSDMMESGQTAKTAAVLIVIRMKR